LVAECAAVGSALRHCITEVAPARCSDLAVQGRFGDNLWPTLDRKNSDSKLLPIRCCCQLKIEERSATADYKLAALRICDG
jgi:hypothetical protein